MRPSNFPFRRNDGTENCAVWMFKCPSNRQVVTDAILFKKYNTCVWGQGHGLRIFMRCAIPEPQSRQTGRA